MRTAYYGRDFFDFEHGTLLTGFDNSPVGGGLRWLVPPGHVITPVPVPPAGDPQAIPGEDIDFPFPVDLPISTHPHTGRAQWHRDPDPYAPLNNCEGTTQCERDYCLYRSDIEACYRSYRNNMAACLFNRFDALQHGLSCVACGGLCVKGGPWAIALCCATCVAAIEDARLTRCRAQARRDLNECLDEVRRRSTFQRSIYDDTGRCFIRCCCNGEYYFYTDLPLCYTYWLVHRCPEGCDNEDRLRDEGFVGNP